MKFCGQCGAKLQEPIHIEQRRPVVIMFADIANYTTLSEKLDPEYIQDILRRCFSMITNLINKYKGTVHQFAGDEVMALFGTPIAYENDAERALRAALEINKGLEKLSCDLGIEIKMHQGLNYGEVVVGAVDTEEIGRETVIGDAVNVAARLEKLAQPGEILVSYQLEHLCRQIFDFTDIGEKQVKGKDEIVRVFRLNGIKRKRRETRGIPGLYSPMIGREPEMAALKRHLESAIAQKCAHAVFVIGEPGVGKSRLLKEFLNTLSDEATGKGDGSRINILFGRCLPLGGSSLGPVIEMLRTLFGIKEDDPIDLVTKKIDQGCQKHLAQSQFELLNPMEILKFLLGINKELIKEKNLSADQMQKQVIMVLIELWKSLAIEKPLAVVIEDLHWADEMTSSFIEQSLTYLFDHRIFFLGLSRPIDYEGYNVEQMIKNLSSRGKTEVIKLRELKPSDVKRIIEALLEIEELPEVLKERIIEDSGGNPLFVEEIIRYLIDQQLLIQELNHWRATKDIASAVIPNTLQGLLLSRIDMLPSEQRSIVQYASVIGRVFWQNIVATLMGKEVSYGLNELAIRDMVRLCPHSMLRDDIEYIFKHILIQEAVYKTMLKKFRVNLHTKVMKLMEERYSDRLENYADLLAYHAERAENRKGAIKYSLMAGDKNRKIFANQLAKKFYQRAIELMAEDKTYEVEKFETGLRLADVCGSMGENDYAIETLNKILTLAMNVEQEAHVLRRTGDAYQRKSQYNQAIQYLGQAIEKIGASPNSLEMINILRDLSWVHYLKGEMEEAQEYVDKAQDKLNTLTNQPKEKVDDVRSAIYNLLAIFASKEGQYDLAIKYHLAHIEIATQRNEISKLAAPYNNLGTVHWGKGDYLKALEYLEKSMGIARKTGEMLSVAVSCNNLGGVYLELGYPERAKEYFELYLDINARIANRLGDAFAHAGLARIYKSQNKYDEAEVELLISLDVSREIGSRRMEANALHGLSDLYGETGQIDLARKTLEQARVVYSAAKGEDEILETKIMLGEADAATQHEKKIEILNRARELLEGVLTNITKQGDAGSIMEINYLLAKIYLELKDIIKALNCINAAIGCVQYFIGQFDQQTKERFLEKKEIKAIDSLKRYLDAIRQ